MICAGIDAGSRTTKIVLVDSNNFTVVASGITDQGVAQEAIAYELFERLINQAGIQRDAIRRIVATGYGRQAISFAHTTVTEITCHACGVRRLAPDVRTVIDIGGQDSKLIRLNDAGMVQDFMMNDRCAAGTGRFLEVVSERLGIPLSALGQAAGRSARPAAISSMCVVFAETEIVGLLTAGTAPEDIVAGVQNSIATRLATMAGRTITPPVVFTGGVALISGMDKALGSTLGQAVAIAPEPQMTGALGAAIQACRQRLRNPSPQDSIIITTA